MAAQAKTDQTKQGTDWFQSQQQYWEQIFQTQNAQWSEFFREWQNGVMGKDGLPGAETYGRYFSQAGQQFLDMMQQFHQSTGQGNKPAGETAKDWAAGLQQHFTRMFKDNFPTTDIAESYKNFMNLGESMVKAGAAWASTFQNNNPFTKGP